MAPVTPATHPPQHLADFHRHRELSDDRPLVIVHGNCQAESLRVVLGGDRLRTVRIPPVHELADDDLPRLRSLLQTAAVLVSQPIRPGYRGLPVGTAQLRAWTRPDARLVVVPVIRDTALYPFHAIVRPPSDPSLTPPLVPYHDLRTLAAAAGRSLREPTAERVRAVARHSLEQLRRRERDHGAIPVSDLLERPHFALMRTINHPGNPVWTALARRVRDHLGIDEPVADPGRPLLDSVHAPRETIVIEALGLDAAERRDWLVDGRRIGSEQARDAHARWYAAHPDAVSAGLARHAAVLRELGLR